MLRHLASHLPFFASVAKHLSFSKAADDLALSQSAVSYQINKLEDKLGFKLFLRGKGSKVELSEKGTMLLNEYIYMEKGFDQLLSIIQTHNKRTNIKLTAPVDLGVKVLVPLLKTLENNDLHIELDLNDELISLKKSQFDLSIRNNRSEPGLQYTELTEIENVIVCSESYAEKSKIRHITDINETHRLLVRDKQISSSWQSIFNTCSRDFTQHQNKQLISNSFGILEAVTSGFGIGILPKYFVNQQAHVNAIRQILLSPAIIKPTKFYIAYQDSTMARKWALQLKDVLNNRLSATIWAQR